MIVRPDPLIFRAYDIRGLLGTEIDENVARDVGRAFASLRQAAVGRFARLLIGRDNRPSSEGLARRVMEGAVEAGALVVDAGLVMTPMVYFGVADGVFDGGLMVTGSHNPPEYNGFKMVEGDGVPISTEAIQEMYRLIEQGQFWVGEGDIEEGFEAELTTRYLDAIGTRIDLTSTPRVVVDAGNAVPGKYVPSLLKRIGCDVTELFCDLDGSFPNHLPDPEMADNLKDLQREVIQVSADIGFGFDGDGDRVGFIDETGTHHEADMLLLLLSRRFLNRHPGEKILIDVKCSMSLIEGIETLGGVPILTATGHTLIKRRMREEGVLLGGEVSGHMFIKDDWYGVDDALLAACHLLELLDSEGCSVSELLKSMPQYPSTPEMKLPCPDDQKFKVVSDMVTHFHELYPQSLTIDGIRIITEDGWALIRSSNTSPYVTVRVEGRTEEGFDRLRRMVRLKIMEYDAVEVIDALLD